MVETNGRSLTREATAQSDNNFVDNSFLEYVPSSFYVLHFFMIIEAWCVIIKCLPRVYIFLFSEYFSLAERERGMKRNRFSLFERIASDEQRTEFKTR